MIKILLVTSVLFSSHFVAAESTQTEHWYSNDQRTTGKVLFKDNCAVCHGDKAQGLSKDWKKALANGKYPAPPLNGTAHTWHHSMDALTIQVRNGGKKLGGWMPPFKDKLNTEQIESIIAFVQSQWTDEIYSAWEERQSRSGGLKAITSIKPKENPMLQYLKNIANGQKLGEPTDTPMASIKQVKMGENYVYITDDGLYAFSGEMVQLKTGKKIKKGK